MHTVTATHWIFMGIVHVKHDAVNNLRFGC